MAVLFGGALRLSDDPRHPDRDRFVLSKGHAALALYAALRLSGRIDRAQLDTFCADGSLLGVHPERALRGVDFSTGSLGPTSRASSMAVRMGASGLRSSCASMARNSSLRRSARCTSR